MTLLTAAIRSGADSGDPISCASAYPRTLVAGQHGAGLLIVKPSHVDWLQDTGQRVKTASGHEVVVWSFNHANDPALLSAWATHFREQYVVDGQLPALVQ